MKKNYKNNFVHDSKCFKCIFEFCTLHLSNFTTYPDVRYISSTDAILIQTRCVQSLFSLEKEHFMSPPCILLRESLREILRDRIKQYFYEKSENGISHKASFFSLQCIKSIDLILEDEKVLILYLNSLILICLRNTSLKRKRVVPGSAHGSTVNFHIEIEMEK